MNTFEDLFSEYAGRITNIANKQESAFIQYCKALSSIISDNFYILDIRQKQFCYIKPNDLFLCGHSVEEAMDLGYDFFSRVIHPEDLLLWKSFLDKFATKITIMKRIFTIVAIILIVMSGCGENKQSTNELITVDVTKNYPEKELILQDFMDVEYIPLETNDEFVTQGKVMAIGTEVILITNWANDGNLFVFDRKTGKALKKINRKGQGGEEYVGITEIVLDEANKEIFVIAYTGSKISVYDLDGNFKRSFKAAGTESHINTFNYDRENLISYVPDNSLENPSNVIHPYYLIFSKQDGSITRKISIPFDEIISVVARDGEAWAAPVPTSVYQIIPDHANWIFMEASSDTIYHYLPDANTTIPLIVRTPSIHTMDSPEVFLIPSVFTDRYYFMSLLKAEFNFETGRGFPTSGLMYDRLENSLFIPKIYNGDYTSKREVDMTSRPLDQEFIIGQSLQAHELVEAYGRGQLKGKLKEIAAKLDEESNPVIILAKHKK